MGQLFANAARAYLSAGIAAGDTTISISSGGALFPVANGTDWFKAVLQDAAGIEIVYVTAHTSGASSFTVTRGQEGTTARSFAAGSVFGLRVTAADTAAFAGKLGDAPSDGKTYGRKDAAWAEVTGGGDSYRVGDVHIGTRHPIAGTWLELNNAVYLQSAYTDLFDQLGLLQNSPGLANAPMTSLTMPTSAPGGENWSGGASSGKSAVVVSGNTTQTRYARTSDGASWSMSFMPVAAVWTDVAYGNGRYVAIASAREVVVSTDEGVTFTVGGSLPGAGTGWNAIIYGGGVFVAFGAGTAAAYSSDGGASWTASTLPASRSFRPAYGNGIFFVGTSGSGAVARSSNGATWTAATFPSGNANSVAFGGGKFIMLKAGAVTTAYETTDGITAIDITIPSGTYTSITYGNGVFVIKPTSTSGQYSPNLGSSWSALTVISAGFLFSGMNRIYCVAPGNSASSMIVGLNYNSSTQFVVPPAIAPDIKSWIKAVL